MNIYEISEDLLAINAQIEENGGELTPEIEAQLILTEENFRNKIDNYCKFITSLNFQIEFAQSEIDRIKDYKEKKENLVNRLKEIVTQAIKLFGSKDPQKDIWRFETGTFKLGTRTSKSVKILDESLIEDRFKKVSFSNLTVEQKNSIIELLNLDEDNSDMKEEISKTKIKEAIENQENVIGAELEIKQSLQMR